MATPRQGTAESTEAQPTVQLFDHEHPTLEEIAAEAYAIYMSNGQRHGHDLGDWLEAERRLHAKRAERA